MIVRFEIHGLMNHSNPTKAARYLEKLLRKRSVEISITAKPGDPHLVQRIRCKCKHQSCMGCVGLALRLYQNDDGRSPRWKCDTCQHTFREGDRRRTKYPPRER